MRDRDEEEKKGMEGIMIKKIRLGNRKVKKREKGKSERSKEWKKKDQR